MWSRSVAPHQRLAARPQWPGWPQWGVCVSPTGNALWGRRVQAMPSFWALTMYCFAAEKLDWFSEEQLLCCGTVWWCCIYHNDQSGAKPTRVHHLQLPSSSRASTLLCFQVTCQNNNHVMRSGWQLKAISHPMLPPALQLVLNPSGSHKSNEMPQPTCQHGPDHQPVCQCP